jgi:adenylosuccinate lyase
MPRSRLWIGNNVRVSQFDGQPLSPLDGRYRNQVGELAQYLSEAALNQARLRVEVEWLIFLAERSILETHTWKSADSDSLRSWVDGFGDSEIAELARIETETSHDVKAVEYLLRGKLESSQLGKFVELIHFGCTSEDINNLAYALTIRAAVSEVWLPKVMQLREKLGAMAAAHHDAAMLARTHGQPATPTTFGKELAVFSSRLQRTIGRVEGVQYLGKFGGATGTLAAHRVAAPDQNWFQLANEFVTGLGLQHNPVTTQIEPHDWQAELFQAVSHLNRILHNLATDCWTYISMDYLVQIPVAGATGSSTMPHKVNPIRFENAEANLELSCAVLDSLAASLVTSRLQRDLTDSSAQRNIGVGFGHSLLAVDNLLRGLAGVEVNSGKMLADLQANWEVLAEAIQSVIRAEVAAGRSEIRDPYALLKELTRGKTITQAELVAFVDGLDISEEAKRRLIALRPERYLGYSSELALMKIS